jgi:flavin reductase (DIM6/NTAB) family NADH-FMN oxidoreductase RutF
MSSDPTPPHVPSAPADPGAAGSTRPVAEDPARAALAHALGRVPSGLFVVSTTLGEDPVGFVGSFVQQVGFAPPTVMVAVATGRDHLAGMRASGRFAVSVLGEDDKGLMRPFFRAERPFDEVAVRRTERGGVVLADALAWLCCRVTGEHTTGDHVVVFGVVEEAGRPKEGAPAVHVRRNGLDY